MSDQLYGQTSGAAESNPDSRHNSTSTQSSTASGTDSYTATSGPAAALKASRSGTEPSTRIHHDDDDDYAAGIANQAAGSSVTPQSRAEGREETPAKPKLGDKLRALGHGGKLQ